jgi:hypothetical protein
MKEKEICEVTQISEGTLWAYTAAVAQATKDGWELNSKNKFAPFFGPGIFSVGMVKYKEEEPKVPSETTLELRAFVERMADQAGAALENIPEPDENTTIEIDIPTAKQRGRKKQ